MTQPSKYQLNVGTLAQVWPIYIFVAMLFCYLNWGLIFEGRIVYGSSFSWQSYPATVQYFNAIAKGVYPLFGWEYGLGFDSLADSQQSLLHPLKILLALVLNTPYRIDTYFLLFHVALLAYAAIRISLHFLQGATPRYERHLIAAYAGIVAMLNIAIFANYIHVYFVAAAAYFLLLMLVVDQFLSAPSRSRFVQILALTTLLLLCGNFAMQWVVLPAIILFAAARVYLEKMALSRILPIAGAFLLAFLLAAPQIIPTYEAMRISVRDAPGGYDKFYMSAGPLQWLGYFAPGSLYVLFKHAHEVFVRWNDNNVLDGVHYLGIMPLALFIYAINKLGEMPRHAKAYLSVALLMALRAAGIFALTNIILNQLPVFGQFRAPIRSFFAVDVFMLLTTVVVLSTSEDIDRKALRRILDGVIVVIALVTAGAFSVAFGWASLVGEKLFVPTLGEVWIAVLSLICAVVARSLLASEHRLVGRRALLLGLVGLTAVDLAAHHVGIPRHWRDTSVAVLEQRSATVDERCRELSATQVWMDFTWPQFDLPIFPLTSSQGRFYTNVSAQSTPELNGRDCTLSYSWVSSRLTALSTVNFYEFWIKDLSVEERRSLLGFVGFKAYAKENALVGHGSAAGEFEIFSAPAAPLPSALDKLGVFIKTAQSDKAPLFHAYLDEVYGLAKRLNLARYLPHAERQVLSISGIGKVIVLTPPFYYKLQYNEVTVQATANIGSFHVLPDMVGERIEVIYVPIPLVVGFAVCLLGLLLAAAALFFWRSPPIEFGSYRFHTAFHRMLSALSSGVTAVVESAGLQRLFLGFFSILAVGISIGGAILLHSYAIAVSFIFVIIFLYAIYRLVAASGKSHRTACGAMALVAMSCVLGMTYGSINALVLKPGILQEFLAMFGIFKRFAGIG